VFEQFDDLLLLQAGGRIVYHGDRNFLQEYIARWYECPTHVPVIEFAMELIESDSSLLQKWQSLGITYMGAEDGSLMTATIREPSETGSIPDQEEIKSPMLSRFSRQKRGVLWYLRDLKGLALAAWKFKLRWHFISFGLLLKREFRRTMGKYSPFLAEPLQHFLCGLFISSTTRSFDFLDRQPEMICSVAPVMLQLACRTPTDLIRESAVFSCIAIYISGISSATSTFGRDRPVFWREVAGGMPVSSFYLAKLATDVPRILSAAAFFTLGHSVFLAYRSNIFDIFTLFLLLYVVAFSQGYLLSLLLRQQIVALAGAGVALAFSLVLSGLMPSLTEVDKYPGSISWLWSISAPRYVVEGYWLLEVSERSFSVQPHHGYSWDDQAQIYRALGCIALVDLALALVLLKFTHRSKQK
jgi:hypothetical protein